MSKHLLTGIVVTGIFWGSVVFSPSAADDAPDVIVLKATLWSGHTKGPVIFNHKKHSETHRIDCVECHHEYEEGANIWIEGDPVQKCQECHDEPTAKDEDKLPEDKKARNLKLAFHNSCRACHQQLKKEDPPKYTNIPTECEKCHQQQKSQIKSRIEK
jgi:hypothetical protein